MRIIAGAWRGRTLLGPAGTTTRPTADRARQALFDTLAHASWTRDRPLAGAAVLDAFAGTGAFGLEALSRGAARAIFMERDRAALRVLGANIDRCEARARSRIVAGDVLRPFRHTGAPVDYACLDPPYDHGIAGQAADALLDAGWIGAGTLLVVEVAQGGGVPVLPGTALDERRHGRAVIHVHRI